ncbi:MAG: LPS export ABC transporter permease LptG [Acidithiobacillus caldus]|nr:LPS export ABC transporter permease LptG [Acidithiobacillus caldus]
MKRADRLLFRGMLGYSTLVLFVLLALMFVANLIAKSGGPGHGSWDMGKLVAYISLQLPDLAYNLIPLALLLGALIWVSLLNSHSELVALRMSGWSLWRLQRPLLWVGLWGALLTFALGEWVVPYTAPAAEAIWANGGQGSGFQALPDGGVWLRQGDQLIQIRAIAADGRRLEGLRIVITTPSLDAVTRMLDAREALYRDGAWQLQGVQSHVLGAQRIVSTTLVQQPWDVRLDPGTLRSFSHPTLTMTLPALWESYQNLQGSVLSMNRFALAFWKRVTYPWVGLVMIWLVVPLVTRNPRGGGLAGRILMGLVLGLAFHFLTEMSGFISISGGIPPVFATVFPLALFASIAWGLQRYYR